MVNFEWLKKMHWHGFNLHISTTSETNWHVFHGLKWSQISLQTALSMLWSCLPLVDKIPSPKTWGLWGRLEMLTHTHTHGGRGWGEGDATFSRLISFMWTATGMLGWVPCVPTHFFPSFSLSLSAFFYFFIFSMDLVTRPVLLNDLKALWCQTGLGSWEASERS